MNSIHEIIQDNMFKAIAALIIVFGAASVLAVCALSGQISKKEENSENQLVKGPKR